MGGEYGDLIAESEARWRADQERAAELAQLQRRWHDLSIGAIWAKDKAAAAKTDQERDDWLRLMRTLHDQYQDVSRKLYILRVGEERYAAEQRKLGHPS
jgi:hypothetical protein